MHELPFRSRAAALIFCAILGPVGVLYSTVLGGVIMCIIGFIVISSKFIVPIILLWVVSCIVGVSAAERYNRKIIKEV